MKKLPLVWVKHLASKQEQKDFELLLRNSTQVLTRLTEIYEDLEAKIAASESSLDDFTSTDWSHKQAFRNGQKATLRELKQLLEFIA